MRSFKRHIALLPFAFVLHNIEEVIYINNLSEKGFNLPFHSQLQFIVAVLLFTILGFVLVFGKNLYNSNSVYQYAIVGFTGMLFLNAIISHIIPSVYFMDYIPGAATAVLLLLPLTACILWKVYRQHLFSSKQLIVMVLLGGIIGIILVVIFLGVAYLIIK